MRPPPVPGQALPGISDSRWSRGRQCSNRTAVDTLLMPAEPRRSGSPFELLGTLQTCIGRAVLKAHANKITCPERDLSPHASTAAGLVAPVRLASHPACRRGAAAHKLSSRRRGRPCGGAASGQFHVKQPDARSCPLTRSPYGPELGLQAHLGLRLPQALCVRPPPVRTTAAWPGSPPVGETDHGLETTIRGGPGVPGRAPRPGSILAVRTRTWPPHRLATAPRPPRPAVH